MTGPERKDYTRAVQCLQTLPSKSDPTWALAARIRYVDLVALHMNQTLFIHGKGLFLTWHRCFAWVYEQALRNECGYKRYQPVCSATVSIPQTELDSTGIDSVALIMSRSRQYSMAMTPVWVVTAYMWHAMEALLVFVPPSSHLEKEADALPVAPSRTTYFVILGSFKILVCKQTSAPSRQACNL